ncbi:hypothetical protein D3C75_1083940 [compost metagenome]
MLLSGLLRGIDVHAAPDQEWQLLVGLEPVGIDHAAAKCHGLLLVLTDHRVRVAIPQRHQVGNGLFGWPVGPVFDAATDY